MLRSTELELDLHEARATYTEALQGTDNNAIATAAKEVARLEREIGEAKRDEAGGLHASAESIEVRGLVRKARVGNYIGALLGDKQLNGAEAELNDAVKVGAPSEGGLIIPHAILAGGGPLRPKAADSDLSSLTAPAETDAVLSRLFAGSDVDFIGTRYISKSMGGDSLIAVVGGEGTGSFAAEGAEVAAVAATVSIAAMKPNRIQESYVLRKEDLARLPFVEMALQDDLRMAVMSGVDKSILNGTGATNSQPEGLLTALAQPDNAPSAKADWAAFVNALAVGVDGIGAAMLSECRLLLGTSAYALSAETVQGAGSDRAVLEYLSTIGGGIRATAHMPAAPTKNAFADVEACFTVRMGAFPSCVLTVWGGGSELIIDPYTGRLTGEVGLTVCSLVDFQVVRNAGFVRGALKLK